MRDYSTVKKYLKEANLSPRQFFQNLATEMNIDLSNEPVEATQEEDGDEVSEDWPAWKKKKYELVSKFCGTQSKSNFETEVVNYMNQTVSPEDSIDTLKLWVENKTSYHSLAKLARFIFSIPASAAAIERVWSTGGLIVPAKRSCLRPDRVNNIIFIHDNYDFCKESL